VYKDGCSLCSADQKSVLVLFRNSELFDYGSFCMEIYISCVPTLTSVPGNATDLHKYKEYHLIKIG